MARILLRTKRITRCEPLYREALQRQQVWRISDRALGPDHPKTLQILVERGLNMMGMGPERAPCEWPR